MNRIAVFLLAVLLLLLLAVAVSASSSNPVSMLFTLDETKEHGYSCIKIPTLLSLRSGRLIAWGEARRSLSPFVNGCADEGTVTDLVMKTSTDNGLTWSALTVFHSNSSVSKNISNVIGNAAPVQLRSSSGKILVVFTRNNLEVWQKMSLDDNGEQWGPAQKCDSCVPPHTTFIGTGPPRAIQLMSGRIVVPSYVQRLPIPHWADGADTRDFSIYNDDIEKGGVDGWRISDIVHGPDHTNENSAVELEPNHLFYSARGGSLALRRREFHSYDGGVTMTAPVASTVPQPIGGCEGSMVFHRTASMLFLSQTVSLNPERYNMTLWGARVTLSSEGSGNDNNTKIEPWRLLKVVDPNRTAYSALEVLPDGRLALLWEVSTDPAFIFTPTAFKFQIVW